MPAGDLGTRLTGVQVIGLHGVQVTSPGDGETVTDSAATTGQAGRATACGSDLERRPDVRVSFLLSVPTFIVDPEWRTNWWMPAKCRGQGGGTCWRAGPEALDRRKTDCKEFNPVRKGPLSKDPAGSLPMREDVPPGEPSPQPNR